MIAVRGANYSSGKPPTFYFCFSIAKSSSDRECWERVHWRGLRAKHRWEGFNAESPVCVACRHGPAERECNVCQDFLCKSCYNERYVLLHGNMTDAPAYPVRAVRACVEDFKWLAPVKSSRVGRCMNETVPLPTACFTYTRLVPLVY